MFLISSTKDSTYDSATGISGEVLESEPSKRHLNKKESHSTGTGELEEAIRSLSKRHSLTPRETEVLGLLARGRSVPFIWDALFISRDTAATHSKHIYTKLDVHTRQELIDPVHNVGQRAGQRGRG